MDLQVEAAVRSLAIIHKVIDLAEIIEWADQIILAEPSPDPVIIELSLAHDFDTALSLLNSFGIPDDRMLVVQRVFSYFYRDLTLKNGDYLKVAEALYYMAVNGWEFDSTMYSYWDDLDLASDGICGNAMKIKKDMLKFLDSNRIG